jgi:hypothetical protein
MLLWKHGPERLLAWHARPFASICEGLVGGSDGAGSVAGLLLRGHAIVTNFSMNVFQT